MHFFKFVIFILGILSIENTFAQSCEPRYDVGRINDTQSLRRLNAYTRCWEIKVPAERNAIVEVTKFTLNKAPYTDVYLRIGARTLRPPQPIKVQIRLMKDEIVTFHAENLRNAYLITASFELTYKVQSLACDQPNPFKCNETECIPQSQRCNGVSECTNGADEVNCGDEVVVTGDLSASREKALKLLNEKQNMAGGWEENTPEAVTAVHLAKGSNFNANCEEKLMAKALELQIVTKDKPTPPEVANFINALRAICADPEDFYGKTFVSDLEAIAFPATAPTEAPDLGKGLVHLALCNAESSKLQENIAKVQELLAATDNDMKYYGILTIACLKRQQLTEEQNKTLQTADKEARTAMNALIKGQKMDGSFSNNVELTAKIAQAWKAINMTGRGQVLQNYQKAIKYLQSEIENSPRDYPSLLSTLPVFGGRSLADIKCNSMDSSDFRTGRFNLTDVGFKVQEIIGQK
ncbi:uncharacterized protein LOC129220525 [Uloborus diversus]|uniref:uncharacterized protein LOC129220525 n=1 Tax=Uloborus diversus TaxID=327109 RepID=UPI0024095A50|nr:uncharacterized protein LOC129220525 [Uloborus diversus]